MIRIVFLFILCISTHSISGQVDTLKYGQANIYVHAIANNEVVCELEGNFDYSGYGPDGNIPFGSIIFQSLQRINPTLSDSIVVEVFSKEQQDGIPDYESRNYFDFESKSIISLEDINRSSTTKEGKLVRLESFYPFFESKLVDCKIISMQPEKILDYLVAEVSIKHAYIHSESPLIIKFEDKASAELLIVPIHKDDKCLLEIYSSENY